MKVALPLDKHAWHPSALPGQIVLVSVAFGWNVGHATYRNVAATEEFVVNVLPLSLAGLAWELADVHGEERRRLAPAFFLEEGVYAGLGAPRRL